MVSLVAAMGEIVMAIVMGDMMSIGRHDVNIRNWLVTPKSEKKILRTVLPLILTTADAYRLKRPART